jgi:hypothetical protein
MAASKSYLGHVERLTGLEISRCQDAIARVGSWGITHVTTELVDRVSADTVVAVTLLAETVADLEDRGVQTSKLLGKLRREPNVWSVWAELRAAAVISRSLDAEIRIELEPGRRDKPQPDYRLLAPEALGGASIEFKAIGLSDIEVAFSQLAARQLSRLVPPIGLTTLHGFIDEPIRFSDAKKKLAWGEAAVRNKGLPAHARALAGAQIVGHNEPSKYLRRLRSALDVALHQLPDNEESWVAFWWSNGAPIRNAYRAVREILPTHIAGVIFVGQAVVPPWPDIHCFQFVADREASVSEEPQVTSLTIADDMASNILDRFDSSSGLRPTLLRAGGRQGSRLVLRDGSRRITPFNLLFDADPHELLDGGRTPSWAQHTKLLG